MAVDLAVVGLSLETAGLKTGGTAAVQTFDRIEQSALKTQQAVAGVGPVMQDVIRHTQAAQQAAQQVTRTNNDLVGSYELEAAAIRAKSAVQLSEVETYKRVVAARNASLETAARERAETEAYVASLAAAETAQRGATATVQQAGKASEAAGVGFARLGYSLASVASQAANVSPVATRLSFIVGSLGVGAEAAALAAGAIVAFGAAYVELTATDRAFQKTLDDTVASLQTAESQLAKTRTAMSVLAEGIDRTDQKLKGTGGIVAELGVAWDVFKRLAVGSAVDLNDAIAQSYVALLHQRDVLRGDLWQEQREAVKQFAGQLESLAGSYGGLLTARLADAHAVATARELLAGLDQQIHLETLHGKELNAAIQARTSLQAALNQPLYDALQLDAQAAAKAKERADLERQLFAVRSQGLVALQRVVDQQHAEKAAVQEAEVAWDIYRKRLGETADAHRTVEQAAAAGNAAAAAYLTTARQNAEISVETTRALADETAQRKAHAQVLLDELEATRRLA
ncbi:MAG TPA: hypothetical protein VI172_12945, partial [Candidatus Dormibacteraeota bacterium]